VFIAIAIGIAIAIDERFEQQLFDTDCDSEGSHAQGTKTSAHRIL